MEGGGRGELPVAADKEKVFRRARFLFTPSYFSS